MEWARIGGLDLKLTLELWSWSQNLRGSARLSAEITTGMLNPKTTDLRNHPRFAERRIVGVDMWHFGLAQ
jgi:hypothetical protein